MAHGSARLGRDRYRTTLQLGNHQLVADERQSLGGRDAGPAPCDLIVAGLAACTAITLRMVADHKGWSLEFVDVEVRFARDDDGARIERTLFLAGVDAEQKATLADIAERTPVTLTLKTGMPIFTTVSDA